MPSTSSRKASLASATGTRISPKVSAGLRSTVLPQSQQLKPRIAVSVFAVFFGLGVGTSYHHHAESPFRCGFTSRMALSGTA